MHDENRILVTIVEAQAVPEGTGTYSKSSACFAYLPAVPRARRVEILPGIYETPRTSQIAVEGWHVAAGGRRQRATDLLLIGAGQDSVLDSFDGRCAWQHVLIDEAMEVGEAAHLGHVLLAPENFADVEGEANEHFVDTTKRTVVRCILNPSGKLWCVQIGSASSRVEHVRIGGSLVAGIAEGKYLSHLFITDIRMMDE